MLHKPNVIKYALKRLMKSAKPKILSQILLLLAVVLFSFKSEALTINRLSQSGGGIPDDSSCFLTVNNNTENDITVSLDNTSGISVESSNPSTGSFVVPSGDSQVVNLRCNGTLAGGEDHGFLNCSFTDKDGKVHKFCINLYTTRQFDTPFFMLCLGGAMDVVSMICFLRSTWELVKAFSGTLDDMDSVSKSIIDNFQYELNEPNGGAGGLLPDEGTENVNGFPCYYYIDGPFTVNNQNVRFLTIQIVADIGDNKTFYAFYDDGQIIGPYSNGGVSNGLYPICNRIITNGLASRLFIFTSSVGGLIAGGVLTALGIKGELDKSSEIPVDTTGSYISGGLNFGNNNSTDPTDGTWVDQKPSNGEEYVLDNKYDLNLQLTQSAATDNSSEDGKVTLSVCYEDSNTNSTDDAATKLLKVQNVQDTTSAIYSTALPDLSINRAVNGKIFAVDGAGVKSVQLGRLPDGDAPTVFCENPDDNCLYVGTGDGKIYSCAPQLDSNNKAIPDAEGNIFYGDNIKKIIDHSTIKTDNGWNTILNMAYLYSEKGGDKYLFFSANALYTQSPSGGMLQVYDAISGMISSDYVYSGLVLGYDLMLNKAVDMPSDLENGNSRELSRYKVVKVNDGIAGLCCDKSGDDNHKEAVYSFYSQTGKFTEYPDIDPTIEIAAFTTTGVVETNGNAVNFYPYDSSGVTPPPINLINLNTSSDTVTALDQDNQGNINIGTSAGEAYVCNPKSSPTIIKSLKYSSPVTSFTYDPSKNAYETLLSDGTMELGKDTLKYTIRELSTQNISSSAANLSSCAINISDPKNPTNNVQIASIIPLDIGEPLCLYKTANGDTYAKLNDADKSSMSNDKAKLDLDKIVNSKNEKPVLSLYKAYGKNIIDIVTYVDESNSYSSVYTFFFDGSTTLEPTHIFDIPSAVNGTFNLNGFLFISDTGKDLYIFNIVTDVTQNFIMNIE